MIRARCLLLPILLLLSQGLAANECPSTGLAVMPLTATEGGPPASYLVLLDGQPQAAINTGVGSMTRLGAQPALQGLFLTALHTAQTNDLPALVAHWKQQRHQPITVYGPSGSRTMPSTTTFVRTLFDGTRGAFRYLGEVVNPLVRDGFRLQAHDIVTRRPRLRRGPADIGPAAVIWASGDLAVHSASTGNTNLPSLAFRVDTPRQSIVVLDVVRGSSDDLAELVNGAGLVIARVQGAGPDGPYLTVKSLARMLKGRGVREVAYTGVDEVAAIAELARVTGAAPASLATRRCWSSARSS